MDVVSVTVTRLEDGRAILVVRHSDNSRDYTLVLSREQAADLHAALARHDPGGRPGRSGRLSPEPEGEDGRRGFLTRRQRDLPPIRPTNQPFQHHEN